MAGKGEPYILVLGQLRAEDRAIVSAAAQRMDADLKATISAKAALEAVQTRQPLLLLIETAAAGAELLCQGVRTSDRARGTPIIGMPRELNDRAFARSFDWGVDDLVELGDWEALERRLLAVRALQGTNRSAEAGEAIVADHDQAHCAVLGRALSSAGYKVRYALDPRSLEYQARQATVKLIVVNPSVGDVWNVMTRARRENPAPAWVIAVAPDEVEHWANRIGDMERVGVTNALGPPENIVFFSNGLLSTRDVEARAAGRNLYGTTVAFRQVGASKDEYGFTYNASRTGMYVRSLLSLTNDDIWVDVRPPRADRYVRLLGRVAWRKTLGTTLGRGTPPGFAIEIVDGLARDMELWASGCEAIEVGSRRRSVSTRPGVIGLGPLETPSDETPISSRPPHDSERPSSVSLKSMPGVETAMEAELPAETVSTVTEVSVADSQPTPDSGPTDHSSPDLTSAGGLLRGRNAPPLVVTLLLCAVVAALVIAPALIWAIGDLGQAPVVRSAPHKPVNERPAVLEASTATPTTLGAAPSASAAANPMPSASATAAASAAPSAAAPVGATTAVENAGSPSSSPLPSAPPVAVQAPPPYLAPQPGDVDLDILPAEHGFLRVLSPAKARVLVQGQDVGETNSWRIVKCGRRFVRLGDGSGGYLEPGSNVFVQCRGATTVQIAPKPAVDTPQRAR
jgi:DNA-binding response OmpR family regulator